VFVILKCLTFHDVGFYVDLADDVVDLQLLTCSLDGVVQSYKRMEVVANKFEPLESWVVVEGFSLLDV
jgi:hypothetical protein